MDLRPVYRLTIFVPPEHLEALIDSILKVTPLGHGAYDRVCWWTGEGVEQFRPLAGAHPGLGTVGELTRGATVRLELMLDRDPVLLDRVFREGIFPAHPWEEPAVFVDESYVTSARP